MNFVFVDTVAWIALINLNDLLHTQTTQVMRNLRQQRALLLTTEFVLIEVADALSAPDIRNKTIAYINGLRRLSILDIAPCNDALLSDGWNLYRQRPDKEWSLTDCISFAFMTQRNITRAFTSDHHFEQAGFLKLL